MIVIYKMKIGESFKNFIASILVIGFVMMPMSMYVKVAHAQPTGYTGSTDGYNWESYGGGSGNAKGAVGYITGSLNIISQFPTCRAILHDAIKNLFNKNYVPATGPTPTLPIKPLAIQPRDNGIGNIKPSQQTLDAIAKSTGVQITAPALEEKIDTANTGIEEIKKSSKALNETESCLNSIGKLIVQRLLQKITLSTAEWIRTGREGGPFYVTNTFEFLDDLAETEILRFGIDVSDPNLFPFGKGFMQRQANYFNRKFTENARYSLNEVIQQSTPQYTANDFRGDFTKGGWNGWLGITQIPANNPLGFEMIASEELGTRINSTVDEINYRLDQADGFLGDQRCVDSGGVYNGTFNGSISKEANKQALISGAKIPIYDPENGKVVGYDVVGACKRWEYVTPGKVMSQMTLGSIEFGKNSLISAQGLNEAVALLLDTIVARWGPELINKGLAGLGATGGADGYLQIDQSQFGHNYVATQVEADFLGTSIRGWLGDNLHFNIRTDLNQALIDEQRTYILKAQEHNIVIDDVMKTIFQLDYCIPGPHPGWEIDSRRILSAAENAIVSKTPADMKGFDNTTEILKLVGGAAPAIGSAIAVAVGAGAAAGSVVPGLGTIIGAAIGLIIGTALAIIDGNEEKLLSSYYSGIFRLLTGVHMNSKNTPPAKITNKHDITKALDTTFERYIQLIHKYYTPGFLPTVTPEATVKFNQIPGYKQIKEDNDSKIIDLQGVVKRLAVLKEKVDVLNAQLGTSPTPDQLDTYEANLKPLINEFGRLSEDMVSGDDIAYIDNSLKQARDEVKYIFTDLIKGPFGCEQDLQFNRQPVLVPDPKVYPPVYPPVYPEKAWILKNTLRAEYPFELWYDYNKMGPNQPLPIPTGIVPYLDPLNMPATTAMPNQSGGDPVPSGPGFLSRVYFDFSDGNSCRSRLPYLSNWELDCLIISDQFQHVNSWAVSVGKNKFDPQSINEQKHTSFEQTIYVY